jgi:hypothetical protein
MPIYKAVATGNRNNELYRETARSIWKKPLIATMPDYSRNTVFILTPLIFRYHLPLRSQQPDIVSIFLPPVSLTPVANLPPVSLIPVANLLPVSTTLAKLVAKFDTGRKFAASVVDTGGNFALIPVVHLDLRISHRIFTKNLKRS